MHLLHFMLTGELEHEIRNRRHLVREGEACLMDLAEPASHENRGKRFAELYWVSFRGPDLDWWFELLKAGVEPVFRGVDRAAMSRLFLDLIRLTEQRLAGYEPRASMLLGGLLAELYASRECMDPLLSWNRDWKALSPPILAAIQIMFIEYSSPMNVRNVAEYAKLSPGRFAHRFRQEVGLSPMAWLARFRIQRAQTLLDGSDRSIAEVGRTVGLPAPAHFARLFRQLTGLSPRKYRQRSDPQK